MKTEYYDQPHLPAVLFGLGRVGRKHLEALQREGFAVQAIVDPAQPVSDQAGNIPIYPHARALLAEQGAALYGPEALDLAKRVYETPVEVLIEALPDLEPRVRRPAPLFAFATPPQGHLEEALRALLAGAHVVVEKPVAMNRDEVEQCAGLAALAARAGLLTAVGHIYRYLPPFPALLPDLQAGRFGRPLWAELNIHWGHDSAYYQAPWRGTIAADGGAILNQSIHGIDLAAALLQARGLESVQAIQRNFVHKIEAEDYATAFYAFENQTVLSVTGTTATWPWAHAATLFVKYEELEIRAHFGGALPCLSLIDRQGHQWRWHYLRESLKMADLDVFEAARALKNPHLLIYRDLRRALMCGRAPLTSLGTGAQAVALALEMARTQ